MADVQVHCSTKHGRTYVNVDDFRGNAADDVFDTMDASDLWQLFPRPASCLQALEDAATVPPKIRIWSQFRKEVEAFCREPSVRIAALRSGLAQGHVEAIAAYLRSPLARAP